MTTSLGDSTGGAETSLAKVLPFTIAVSMMGLDLVYFKKHFQVLYRVHPAYMGPCKEAAHVATHYTIQHLWKDAVVHNAVLLPPPITPTLTMNSVSSATTILQPSTRYLSGVARKSLLA